MGLHGSCHVSTTPLHGTPWRLPDTSPLALHGTSWKMPDIPTTHWKLPRFHTSRGTPRVRPDPVVTSTEHFPYNKCPKADQNCAGLMQAERETCDTSRCGQAVKQKGTVCASRKMCSGLKESVTKSCKFISRVKHHKQRVLLATTARDAKLRWKKTSIKRFLNANRTPQIRSMSNSVPMTAELTSSEQHFTKRMLHQWNKHFSDTIL